MTIQQNNTYQPFAVEETLYVKSVSHGGSGGRKVNFSSLVIVGDQKNTLGIGYAKASKVRDSINKAIFSAKKNVRHFHAGGSSSIPFPVEGKSSCSRVILKPVKEGHGLIASFVVRTMLNALGIRNITSKVYGSRHRKNVCFAVLDALEKINHYHFVFKERQKMLKELKDKQENNNE